MNKTNSVVVPVPSEAERVKMTEMLRQELSADQFARVIIEVRPDAI